MPIHFFRYIFPACLVPFPISSNECLQNSQGRSFEPAHYKYVPNRLMPFYPLLELFKYEIATTQSPGMANK